MSKKILLKTNVKSKLTWRPDPEPIDLPESMELFMYPNDIARIASDEIRQAQESGDEQRVSELVELYKANI